MTNLLLSPMGEKLGQKWGFHGCGHGAEGAEAPGLGTLWPPGLSEAACLPTNTASPIKINLGSKAACQVITDCIMPVTLACKFISPPSSNSSPCKLP